jgi:hypothetical protein
VAVGLGSRLISGSGSFLVSFFLLLSALCLGCLFRLALSQCVLDEAIVFNRVDLKIFDMDVRNRCVWFLRFEPWFSRFVSDVTTVFS